MTLTRTSKSNPCPICYAHKSCSYDEQHNRYFCFNTLTDDGEFKLIRSKSGFGIFKKAGVVGQAFNSPKGLKKGSSFKQQQQTAPVPSVVSQDIEKLTQKLVLVEKHHKQLLARGLSSDFISQQGFCSIVKNQKTDAQGIAAGTSVSGEWLNSSGLIIPIKDVSQTTVGYQLKPDFVINNAKYKWTKGYDGDKVINTAHLNYGGCAELPIQVAIAKRLTRQVLYLTEGILKPLIFHHLFGVNVIGASGGLFESSPNAFREALETIRPSKVIFAADAGSGINSNVVRAMSQTASLVEEILNIEMQVLDYGQTQSKESPDPDEIDLWTFETAGITSFRNWKFIVESDNSDSDTLKVVDNVLNADDFKKSVVTLTQNAFGSDFSLGKTGSNIVSPKLNVGRPGLYYEPEQHQAILSVAYAKGYKAVLDVSGTGKGKSHLSGLLQTSEFAKPDGSRPDKIFYLSSQHRNPTTPTIEQNFVEHPTKNTKLYTHPEKKTALGRPVLMRDKQGNRSIAVPGNCHKADAQQKLYDTGAKFNLCSTCKFAEFCSTQESPGEYGYKYQVSQAMSHDRIRANIQGLNFSLTNEEKEELGLLHAANANNTPSVRPNDVAVIDEYTQTLDFVNTYQITAYDWVSQQHSFRKVLGDRYSYLSPIQQFFDGKLDTGAFGWNINTFFSHFSARPALATYAEDVAEDQADTNFFEIQSGGNPSLEFGGDLLKALSGQHHNISLTFNNNKITVYKRNDDLLKKLDRFGMVVYMDATSTREQLASLLDCDVNEILLISQKPSKTNHVTIKQVVSLGALGCSRTPATLEKLQIVRKALKAKYGDEIGFIDWKRFAKPGDLYHFVDGRGSNAFQTKKAVASFGIANTNVTAAIALYEVIDGVRYYCDRAVSITSFNKFYQQLQQAEVEQELGRLRASRREDEQLDFYSFSTFDLSFLVVKGYKYEIVRGYDIDMEICSLKDKALYAVKQLASREELRKMSLNQFCKFADINRNSLASSIRREFSTIGGWESAKESLIDAVFHKPERLTLAVYNLHKNQHSDKVLLANAMKTFRDVAEGFSRHSLGSDLTPSTQGGYTEKNSVKTSRKTTWFTSKTTNSTATQVTVSTDTTKNTIIYPLTTQIQ